MALPLPYFTLIHILVFSVSFKSILFYSKLSKAEQNPGCSFYESQNKNVSPLHLEECEVLQSYEVRCGDCASRPCVFLCH
jgi:hypothetical protein